ncbi:related to haloacid dehalogenase, type II [Rhynchosporium graminicola]|uniref:Related to haloacid dehalogenase, type II n=1 Tax=Rhynchosporium graminicola TaxID=2792576 RepID=A0A1E1L7R3_9HELO|nr:related to haloacid dehalogenase, type II [Rhynchosporium commune]
MSSTTDIFQSPPKGLTFDVFGTVVNWRDSVTSRLIQSAAAKASSSSQPASLSPEVRARLSQITDEDWAQFAEEWRKTYYKFTLGFMPGQSEWRDIDTHHHISLIDLLKEWGVEGLYDDNEIKELSLIWHFLDPWKDSSAGIHALGKKLITSSLSNGNQSLLKDLQKHGDLGFRMLQSSGDFKAYKPHPSTYEGAAEKMGLKTSEVAMVAAHLNDLKAARECGMRTIYVERRMEEAWSSDSEDFQDAKTWVDIWVKEDEDGFLEVARRFGITWVS